MTAAFLIRRGLMRMAVRMFLVLCASLDDLAQELAGAVSQEGGNVDNDENS